MNMYKLTIALFCISLLITLLVRDDIAGLVNEPEIPEEFESGQEGPLENPLYKDLEEAGARYGVDMEFARNAEIKEHRDRMETWSFLDAPWNSYDIIVLGDSSIAWGLIPEVLEQHTGLRVGNYAFEANVMTTRSMEFFEKVTECYLKPGGKVLVSFNPTNQEQESHRFMLPSNSAHALELRNYFKLLDEGADCQALFRDNRPPEVRAQSVAEEEATPGFLETLLSFSQYQALLDSFREVLKDKLDMRLPEVTVYETYLEQYFNPDKFQKKEEVRNSSKLFLQWNDRSVTLYSPRFNEYSWPLATPFYRKMKLRDHVEENARSLADFASRYQAIYIIPLYENLHPRQRQFYDEFLRDAMGLIDLPAWFANNREPPVVMEGGTHPGNLGGFRLTMALAVLLDQPEYRDWKNGLPGNTTHIATPQVRFMDLFGSKDNNVIFVAATGDKQQKMVLDKFPGLAKAANSRKNPSAFIALVEGGEVSEITFGNEALRISKGSFGGSDFIDEIEIISTPNERASVRINGKEYLNKHQGLHVLVFDRSSQQFTLRYSFPLNPRSHPDKLTGKAY